MEEWIKAELSGVDLGDERLNQRYALLLDRIHSKPSLSIPGATEGWSETQAAYRFFSNNKVNKEVMLSPHIQATRERIKQHPVVLCVEDTSFINYDGQEETQGLGPHSSELEHGYFLHPLVAFTPEKLCLGTLRLHTWIRDGKFGKRYSHAQKPIEEKESHRWINGYHETNRLQEEIEQSQLVYMADREADIYELFSQGCLGKANWLIRARRNRKTIESNKIRDELTSSEALGELRLNVSYRKKRKRREASLTLYSRKLELLGPRRAQRGKLPDLHVNVILAVETNPPKDEEPIEWLLLTDMEISTLEEAKEKLHWYSCRWQIEIFFNTLKSGCQIEKLQLETRERLENAVTLYMIVAWRLLYIKTLSRLFPDSSCEIVFSKQEWEAVCFMSGQTELPRKAPTVGEIALRVAMSGGYLNRKHDSPPGVKVLWIGLQRLRDFIQGFEAAKKLLGTQ